MSSPGDKTFDRRRRCDGKAADCCRRCSSRHLICTVSKGHKSATSKLGVVIRDKQRPDIATDTTTRWEVPLLFSTGRHDGYASKRQEGPDIWKQ